MLRTVLGFDAATAARILGKRPGAVRAAAHRGSEAAREEDFRGAVTPAAPATLYAVDERARDPTVPP